MIPNHGWRFLDISSQKVEILEEKIWIIELYHGFIDL